MVAYPTRAGWMRAAWTGGAAGVAAGIPGKPEPVATEREMRAAQPAQPMALPPAEPRKQAAWRDRPVSPERPARTAAVAAQAVRASPHRARVAPARSTPAV